MSYDLNGKEYYSKEEKRFLPTTMLASNEWKWIHNIWQKTASTSIPSPAHLHRLYFFILQLLEVKFTSTYWWLVLTKLSRNLSAWGRYVFYWQNTELILFINWGENPWQLVVRIERNCTKDLKREQSTHYFQFSIYFYNHKFILFLLCESDKTPEI